MLKIVLPCAILLISLFSQSAFSEPIVWKIYDQNREFIVLGSIHTGKENMYPLPQIFLNQWQQADALIVEANILQQSNMIPTQHPPLTQQVLTPIELNKLKTITHSLNIPFARSHQQPPWLTAITLQMALAHKLGLKSELGIDYTSLKRAQQQNLPIKELESVEQQFSILENLPHNGTKMLTEVINNWEQTQSSLLCLIEAWQYGDSQKLEQLFNDSLLGSSTDASLIFDRNMQWVKILTESKEYQQGKYIVVVGAFHLIGKQGLPNLMKQRGFKVKRITLGNKTMC